MKTIDTRYLAKKWGDKLRGFIINFCIAVILIGTSYIILTPILSSLSHAFMHHEDLRNPMIFMIPENFTLYNMRNAFEHMAYIQALTNTLIYSLGMALLHVLIGSLVGYGFARFRVPGEKILFIILITTIVVPVHAYIVPLFMQFRFFNILGFEFNLISTYYPMILMTLGGVGLRSGLFIFIYRQFFRGLPKEIEEAALIDGAGIFRTFFRVMLPNSLAPTLTVLLFSLVWHYNDMFYLGMLMPGTFLMPVALTSLEWNYRWATAVTHSDWGQISLVMYAGVILVIAPVLTIYFLLQRYFLEGIERSGIVG